MLHMTGGGRDKQQIWLCYVATSLLLAIHATSLNTPHSYLATHVAEREERPLHDARNLKRQSET